MNIALGVYVWFKSFFSVANKNFIRKLSSRLFRNKRIIYKLDLDKVQD